MPYRFLEYVAIADAAFQASGKDLPEMFMAAAAATMNVMVEDLSTIDHTAQKTIELHHEALDMLLFNFLQEFIFFKDAERLLLRPATVQITRDGSVFSLRANLYGEIINPDKHVLLVDVKAVTLHHFEVKQTGSGWEAFVIVDT